MQPLAQNPSDIALARIAAVQAQASHAGITLRQPPPIPTTCCGRGCNGCVWEGYFDAVTWWLEDAAEALAGKPQGA